MFGNNNYHELLMEIIESKSLVSSYLSFSTTIGYTITGQLINLPGTGMYMCGDIATQNGLLFSESDIQSITKSPLLPDVHIIVVKIKQSSTGTVYSPHTNN